MTAPLSLIGYRLASFLATPLAGPILAMRLRRGKEDPRRVGERRGVTGLVRPPGPLVWLHGASVGEAGVLMPFVERITRMGSTALVTTTTVTSAAMLAQRLPRARCINLRRSTVHCSCGGSSDVGRPDAALVAEIRALAEYDRRAQRSGLSARDGQRTNQRAVVSQSAGAGRRASSPRC